MHDPGKCRGITVFNQILKLWERVLDARIRRRIEGDFGGGGGRTARIQEGERNSRMANRSYWRHWRSGTGCLPDTG